MFAGDRKCEGCVGSGVRLIMGVKTSAPGSGSLGSSLGTRRKVREFNVDAVEFVAEMDRLSKG